MNSELDRQGAAGVEVTCGTGSDGCAGSLAATADGKRTLGTVPFTLRENATATLRLPPVPPGIATVGLAVALRRGTGAKATTLTLQAR